MWCKDNLIKWVTKKIDYFSLDDSYVVQERGRIEFPVSPVIGLVTPSVI